MWEPLELGEREKQLLLQILVQQQQLMAKLNIQALATQLTTEELVNGSSSSSRFGHSGEQVAGNAEFRTPHTVKPAGLPRPVHLLQASGEATTVEIDQHPSPPTEVVINKMAGQQIFHHTDQSAHLDQAIDTHTSCRTSAPKLKQLIGTNVNGLSGKCHSDDVMIGDTQHDHNPHKALHCSGEHCSTDITIQSRYVLPIHPKTPPRSVLPKINQNVHIGSSISTTNRRDPQSTGYAGRFEDTRRRALKISSTGGEDLRQIITFLLGNRLHTFLFRSLTTHFNLDQFDSNVKTDVWSSRKGHDWPWDPGPSRVNRVLYVVWLHHQLQLDPSHPVDLIIKTAAVSTNTIRVTCGFCCEPARS